MPFRIGPEKVITTSLTMSDDPVNQKRRLQAEIARRRTFAIISHPDAGKTTLTEKLLLYGGAIHLAGAVKAKGSARKTTSDWMEIEKQRGISISTSVLRFEYEGKLVNLLDTPGHKDFSEDTYRTLVAVDSAVMLIDAAKGVEPQTRKLFEICRMRGIPIFTFINKLDRPGRDPFELLDELEKVLGIRSCPVSWPIGMGPRFKGVYDRAAKELLLFKTDGKSHVAKEIVPRKVDDIRSKEIPRLLANGPADLEDCELLHQELLEQLDLVDAAAEEMNMEKVLAGQLSPVFFGSAMNNFGVQHFLETFLKMAPCPGPRKAVEGDINPENPEFSGFFFKIQANMDPQHRDRVSFLRVGSGRYYRNIPVTHARLKKDFRLNKALHFFAQERELIEEAFPGDVIGMLDTTGDFRIGDSLYENKPITYEGVPRFSPENFTTIAVGDPLRRKQMQQGLEQLSEEGVVQMFHHWGGGNLYPILGAVGALQFEVLEHRLKAEYKVDLKLERMPFIKARWIVNRSSADFAKALENFRHLAETQLVEDRDKNPVVLFRSEWSVGFVTEKYKDLDFLPVAPLKGAEKK